MNERLPDPDGLAYARYWEPVLAGPAQRLLTRIRLTPADCLDIGAGTGSLSLAAAARWPDARIVGLDASAGMLSVARYRIATERPTEDPGRFEWIAADAARLPFPDASFDIVTSSFMLQLVDDRAEVLSEVLRVLRPGGAFALVSWLAGDIEIAADAIFDDCLTELGLERPRDDFPPSETHDFRDVDAARSELVSAGFGGVEAGAEAVRYAWSRDGYLDFKENYDEYDLFESLSEVQRDRSRELLRARWATAPDTAFAIDGPSVWATGRQPHHG